MHALKDLQFFTPQQYKALEERANKEWIKTYLADVPTELNGVQMSRLDAYKQLGLTQEEIVEEAISDAFGAYDKGATPPPGMIAALFKKLKNFFANFGQALRGAGFESADDVFQRVERGELKSRKPKGEAKIDVRAAAAQTKVEPKAEEKVKPDEAEPEQETKEEKLSLKTVDEVIKDGSERLLASARKSGLNTLEERYMVGLARADTSLTKIQDGIEKRLQGLGLSRPDSEDIVYNKVLPAVRAGLKKEAKFSLAGDALDGEVCCHFAPNRNGLLFRHIFNHIFHLHPKILAQRLQHLKRNRLGLAFG
jgi:hypothetical protein